jgi:hypothetical protein
MARTISQLTATALLCFLTACGNTAYFEPGQPSVASNALVYIYRPAATNPGKKPLRTSYPEILVNGEKSGLLKYQEHFPVELEPGKYQFVATGLTADARWKPKDRSYTLKVEPGEIYYLRLQVEFNTDKMSIGSFRDQYLIFLHQVDRSEAIYQIRETCAAR